MADETATTPPDSYLVPAGTGTAEIRVQRSRFLALVAPVPDEAAARAEVHAQARRHHDARHVCHAWRLGSGPLLVENRNDAGEPAGTAGQPILVALRRAALSDCVGVVVRWFGGIKLGTGGLARAYGEAAAQAVAATPVREVLLGRSYELTLPYPLQKTVRHLLTGRGGRVVAEAYGTEVTWRIWLPHSGRAGFAGAISEATAGAVTVGDGEDRPLDRA